ncbi:heparin lyase I family protein [Dongia deserti]|uniref:heparin lyase I family protein n=1 Tax=Dongia deserti TaxID=2268030 RepID=UPI0013C532B6|nr:heparin lyase I family protein [Dongia deserti]
MYLPGATAAQSPSPVEAAGATKVVPADALTLSAEFEGTLDQSVNTAYFCKGVARFIPTPTSESPSGQALLLTLDPSNSSSVGRCEPDDAGTERAELAEPDAARLPLGTEVWYGFRFMVPAAMKGRFAGQRLVIAQLKQHPETCPLGPRPFGLPANAHSNPTVSLRLIEDNVGDVMGLQLAVSGDQARKISVGQLMRHRDPFLDRWHEVLLHVKVMPQGRASPGDSGFVEGWLDGQPFADGLYGVEDDSGIVDRAEPFGYSGLVGCTYFKYGIYRDRQDEPWSIAFDRFRRGATRKSVESSSR